MARLTLIMDTKMTNAVHRVEDDISGEGCVRGSSGVAHLEVLPKFPCPGDVAELLNCVVFIEVVYTSLPMHRIRGLGRVMHRFCLLTWSPLSQFMAARGVYGAAWKRAGLLAPPVHVRPSNWLSKIPPVVFW